MKLDVLGKESDNKFNFRMIMQKVDFCDDIVIRKMKAQGIKLNTNLPWVPTDSKNLVYKVVEKIKKLDCEKIGNELFEKFVSRLKIEED